MVLVVLSVVQFEYSGRSVFLTRERYLSEHRQKLASQTSRTQRGLAPL